MIQRIVKSCLIDHVTYNKLLNAYQSAYCKHHSIETALLYIHDYHFNAIGSQKVSCLTLLDLSAAFDAIDHNILITRFSSLFGIHGSVLSWFKSCHLASLVLNVITTSLPFVLWCSPRLCSRPSTPHHVHYSSQYSDFFPFHRLPPLCRWNSALLLFPPTRLWLKHFSPSKCSSTDLFLDDC